MATSSSTWKRAERNAAAIFGVLRRPLSGSSNRPDIDGDDAIHPVLWIESKLRSRRNAVFTLWREVRAKAKKAGKEPVIVLREKGVPGCLVVMDGDSLGTVVVEWLAGRTEDQILAIEATVRARRAEIAWGDPEGGGRA